MTNREPKVTEIDLDSAQADKIRREMVNLGLGGMTLVGAMLVSPAPQPEETDADNSEDEE